MLMVAAVGGSRQCGCAHYVTSSYPDQTPPLNNRLLVPYVVLFVVIKLVEASEYILFLAPFLSA
jgi:hypothetical protein